MGKLAQVRRTNEIKNLLGEDNFDLKYQKVAYWDGQPVVVGKNELEGFYFELAGCGYIGNTGCLENALTGSRKLFNVFFRKIQSLYFHFKYDEDAKGDIEEAYELMMKDEEDLERWNYYS